jgi:hypothetical protein
MWHLARDKQTAILEAMTRPVATVVELGRILLQGGQLELVPGDVYDGMLRLLVDD